MEAKLRDGSTLHVNSEERIYAITLSEVSVPIVIDQVEGERLLIEYAEQLEEDYQHLKGSLKIQTDSAVKGWEKVIKYETALNFYADERSYVTDIKGMKIESTIMQDKGDYAKEVLKG